jgi:hypothetical protein
MLFGDEAFFEGAEKMCMNGATNSREKVEEAECPSRVQ